MFFGVLLIITWLILLLRYPARALPVSLAAAVGLGLQLWLPGVACWFVGHMLAVWGARVDVQFMPVFARHVKHPALLDV